MRSPRRFATSSAAVTLAVLLPIAGAPHAFAGPDDGAWVATQGHVDAPKAFWENNNFVLRTETGGEAKPIEESVIWIGKGSGKQQYIYEVGNTEGEEFLGDNGTLHYWGPAVTSRGYPIWVGFGADIGIPADQFRDGSFTLDIVDFDGPGRMEMFTNPWDGTGLNRLWSSHDPGLRQTWVNPGTHTHNETTFTKPGRYEVTYRATARDKDNNLIASPAKTAVWQVGGTRPADSGQGIGDVATAYNAARAETLPDDPRLTIRPHTGTELPGAEHLTDLVFETGNSADNGHAIFYIDGYHLAEVPVVDGRAEWPEMIGSYSSNFQVVYVPGSSGQRWVSAPLGYDRTMAEASTGELGEFPAPASADPAPAFDNELIDVADPSVTATSKSNGDQIELTVTPADPNLSLRINGGIYEGDSEYPDCYIEFTSTPQNRTRTIDSSDCTDEGHELRFDVTPSAYSSAGATTIAMGYDDSVTGRLGGKSAPVETEPKETEPAASEPAETERVEISQGHVDLGPVRQDDGSVKFLLGDESGQHSSTKVYRQPEDVTMLVDDHFQHTLTDKQVAGPLGSLGEPGDDIYLMQQSQRGNELWPGFSSEHSGGVAYDFEIEPDSAPTDGRWYAFTSGSFGGVGEMLGSSEGPSRFERSETIHLHNNWVFTKPGEYRIKMRAVEHGNDANATEWATVVFHVGDAGEVKETTSASETVSESVSQEPSASDEPTASVEPTNSAEKPSESVEPSASDEPTTSAEKPTTSAAKPSTSAAKPSTPPANSAPEPTPPSKDVEVGQSGHYELSQGHIDLGPVSNGGTMEFRLGDESGQYDAGKVFRDPEDVTMLVGDEFSYKLSEDNVSGDLGFLGQAGTSIHLMGQVQSGNELWPGFSTEHTGGQAWDIELEPVSAPDGGRWFAYTSGAFGGVGEHLGSSDGGSMIVRDRPVHLHNNWAFTAPGEYKIRMRGLEHNNHSNATSWKVVTFRVGGDNGHTNIHGNEAGAGAEAPPAPATTSAAKPGSPAAGGSPASGGAGSAPSSGSGSGAAPGSGSGSSSGAGAPAAPGNKKPADGAKPTEPKKNDQNGKGKGKEPAKSSKLTDKPEPTIWDRISTVISLIMSFVGLGLGGLALWRRFGPFF